MPEIVVGTYRPDSREQGADDFKLPGPGVYEADFEIPSIIAEALPDKLITKTFEHKISGKLVRHVRTTLGEKRRVPVDNWFDYDVYTLTVRFEVEEAGPDPAPGYMEAGFGAVVRPILSKLIGPAVASLILGITLKALIEVRKILASPGGQALGLGAGILAASVGVALLLSKRG